MDELIWVLCGFFAVLALLSYYLYILWKALQSKSWVSIPCKIHSADITKEGDSDEGEELYYVRVMYSYIVDKQVYASELVYYGDHLGMYFQSSAARIKKKFFSGHLSRAYYNPSKPSESVLIRGANTHLYVVIGALMALLAIAGYIMLRMV